jgi:hypothetical protein
LAVWERRFFKLFSEAILIDHTEMCVNCQHAGARNSPGNEKSFGLCVVTGDKNILLKGIAITHDLIEPETKKPGIELNV